MKTGYIKICRSIEDWRWFNTPHMLEFWLRLLLKANWRDEEIDGEVFKRGEIVTSIPDLARETRLTVKQVRVFLGRLVETGEITVGMTRSRSLSRTRTGTSSRTRITICNYATYQSIGREVGQKVRRDVGHDVGHELTPPPYSPSSSSPAPSSSTPPISPSLFEEEKEGDANASRKKGQIDYDYILGLWNNSMTRKVPKVKAISDSRKEKIRLRIQEMGGVEQAEAILTECFKKMNDSEFCNGENDSKWVATFDWFFRSEQYWVRVLEGNYDNRQRKTRLEQLAELSQKGHEYYNSQRYGYGSTSPYGNPQGGRDDSPDEQ